MEVSNTVLEEIQYSSQNEFSQNRSDVARFRHPRSYQSDRVSLGIYGASHIGKVLEQLQQECLLPACLVSDNQVIDVDQKSDMLFFEQVLNEAERLIESFKSHLAFPIPEGRIAMVHFEVKSVGHGIVGRSRPCRAIDGKFPSSKDSREVVSRLGQYSFHVPVFRRRRELLRDSRINCEHLDGHDMVLARSA